MVETGFVVTTGRQTVSAHVSRFDVRATRRYGTVRAASYFFSVTIVHCPVRPTSYRFFEIFDHIDAQHDLTLLFGCLLLSCSSSRLLIITR
jgi:hypothetical protein